MTGEVDDLKNKIAAELSCLSALPEAEKTAKNKEIKELIQYYRGMTAEMEERRAGLYNFTLQYIVILLTALGAAIAVWNDLQGWRAPIIWFLLPQIVATIAILVVYESQSWYKPPFVDLKEFGNQWKWFYYGNPSIERISTRVVPPSKDPEHTVQPYLSGLLTFVTNYRTENLDRALRENILQLYLLQVHNYYKNQFYLALVRIRLVSLLVTAMTLGGAIVWTLLTG